MKNWYYSNKGIVYVYKNNKSNNCLIRGFNSSGSLKTFKESEVILYCNIPTLLECNKVLKNKQFSIRYQEEKEVVSKEFLLKKELKKQQEINKKLVDKLEEKIVSPIKSYIDSVIL